jgi:glycosyltransferase involved in cell wall biosynthesis
MSAPLRINFFVQFVHEQGTYFRFHNLARALIALGQDVTVYASDHDRRSKSRQEVREGVNYFIMPSLRGFSLFSPVTNPLNAMRRGLERYPACDVAHLFQPFPSAMLAWKRCKADKHFYDWDDLWVGGFWADKPRSLNGRLSYAVTAQLERKLPHWSDHVTTCSRFLAALAMERGGHDASVIYNGLWPEKRIPKDAARKRLGLRPDAVYVGFMGRTCNELHWCFQGMEENLDRIPNLRFALCGAPADALEGLPTKLRERVDFLGQLKPAETRYFSATLDLALLPLENTAFNQSRYPIKFAEYMGAGAPVLCSNVGECSMLKDRFPWVFNAGRTKHDWLQAFRQAVDSLAAGRHPEVDESAVNAFFCWEHIALGLLEIYRQTLNPGGSSILRESRNKVLTSAIKESVS